MNAAEQMLRNMVDGWKQLGHRHPIDAFLLEHGRAFDEIHPDSCIGTPKECYANSARRVIRDDSLIYVEGYGLILEFGFPFLHAWLTDESGRVIETTLQDPEKHAYFGVSFNTEFVLGQMVKYEVWGILGGMPQQAMELIENTATSVWKHEPALGLDAVEEERASQNRN